MKRRRCGIASRSATSTTSGQLRSFKTEASYAHIFAKSRHRSISREAPTMGSTLFQVGGGGTSLSSKIRSHFSVPGAAFPPSCHKVTDYSQRKIARAKQEFKYRVKSLFYRDLPSYNSTDYTDDLIDEYIGRLPVRHEFEPRPGKSIAPNRAIDVAKGDFIIWIVIHDHNFPSNTVRNSHRYKRIEGSTQ